MRLSANNYIKKIISVSAVAVLTAVFIVTMFFCSPKIFSVPETTGKIARDVYYEDGVMKEHTYTVGVDLTAVRINDLGRLGKITEVNYVPDKFVSPDKLTDDIQIVDLTKSFDFAEKGTLIFVIMNLDPWAEDYTEQRDALSDYKLGDSWHFTMSLPKIFCASNIYLKDKLLSRNGEIENYNFIDFTDSYKIQTEKLSCKTAKTIIDLTFNTSRELMSHTLIAAQIITIHYQSTGSAYSGIADCPLIGAEDAVTGVSDRSQDILIAFTILSAVALAVLAVLSVLERSDKFIPSIICVTGICLLLLSRFFLSGVTAAPLLCTALALSSSFVILCGAQLSVGGKIGAIPAGYIAAGIALFGAVLAFIRPFVPFGAAAALQTVCTVVKAISAALLLTLIGISTLKENEKNDLLRTAYAAIIAVGIIASLFLPQIFPAQYNPMFWTNVATTVLIFVSVFVVFNHTKKSNDYLTNNLHMEVERQLKDIKAIIDERDKLLQFVSHDMKKPLDSSVSLLDTAIEREKDSEQIKTLRIIKQNDSRVITNLSEIGAYAKFNYIAETSQVVDLYELCEAIWQFHSFDCNANGIVLKNLVNRKVKVFVKKQGLENAVSNIIMNAVEHANCSSITMFMKYEKNKAILCIVDDGKGISSDIDVFKPYYSENKPETGGIGLYICKNIIESMNGSLSYESRPGETMFCISLLKA